MTPILAKIRAAGGSARLVDGKPVVRGVPISVLDEIRPFREALIRELRREEDPYAHLPRGEKVAFVLGIRNQFLAKVGLAGDPASLAAGLCETWLTRIRADDGSDVRWLRANREQMAEYLRLVCPGVLEPWIEGQALVNAVLAAFPGSSPYRVTGVADIADRPEGLAALTSVDGREFEVSAQEGLGL